MRGGMKGENALNKERKGREGTRQEQGSHYSAATCPSRAGSPGSDIHVNCFVENYIDTPAGSVTFCRICRISNAPKQIDCERIGYSRYLKATRLRRWSSVLTRFLMLQSVIVLCNINLHFA